MEQVQIQSEIAFFKEKFPEATSLQDDKIFDYVMLKLFYMHKASFDDLHVNITDGANDGGIDFLFFDEEENKLVVAQCKYTTSLSKRAIIDEFNMIERTLEKFRKADSGSYNHKLKYALQNAIDRFDTNNENIEYALFTTAELTKEDVFREIDSVERSFSSDSVFLFDMFDILEVLDRYAEENQRVFDEYKLNIDRPGNILTYNSPTNQNADGILVNVSSKSIQKMYNRYINHGLLDMNIRKFIANKSVDTGIKQSLAHERDIFWFLNNGITIACEEYYPDGDNIKISNFSIINGGQTTTLIGKDSSSDQKEFFIPCKIISYSNSDQDDFFLKIARATNSQKPIQLRDLNSNSPEMKRLAGWLAKDYKIFLEIKRGEKRPSNRLTRTVRNDELGQLLLSLVYQQPGSARSSKKVIFENKEFYSKIFKKRYDRDERKRNFIVDLIDTHIKYESISKKLLAKDNNTISYEEQIILANGKYCIFALFGILSLIVNDMSILSIPDIKTDCQNIKDIEFPYNMIIGNYKGDDIDEKFEQLIIMISSLLAEIYISQLTNKEITSASNLFKGDKKYYDVILKTFFSKLNFPTGKDIMKISNDLFKA